MAGYVTQAHGVVWQVIDRTKTVTMKSRVISLDGRTIGGSHSASQTCVIGPLPSDTEEGRSVFLGSSKRPHHGWDRHHARFLKILEDHSGS